MKSRVSEKRKIVLLHVLIWLIGWFTISFLASKGKKLDEYLIKNISFFIPLIAIVYVNWFWLFPTFFKAKKYWKYIAFGLLLIYFIFYLGEILIVEWISFIYPHLLKKDFDYDVYSLPTSFWDILYGAALYTLGLLGSTIFLAIKQNHKDKQEIATLQLENAQTKIKYLQSQISPHFLFNSLNNVHSLILQDKNQAADYIIQLSNLLRFMVYETDKEFITLGEEINLIKRYVQLTDFRVGSNTASNNLIISIENNELKLPPLLIFGILENGIKHSGMGIEGVLEFNISIKESKGELILEMNNSISKQKFDLKKKGFGIDSLKKRLLMYYPNKHTFVFEIINDTAKTKLNLILDSND
ncbi:sensor histidine kinase [Winogradskyella sp. R77965]|uniref:sensor histidine kinase n=1 Tax=Winogradskyella sp. R77965 TaxID=3093872 RepID=UPI0037DDB6E3